MSKTRNYTVSEAAKKLRWNKSQISRWSVRLGFGRKEGKYLYLNSIELAALLAVKRATVRGNPNYRQ